MKFKSKAEEGIWARVYVVKCRDLGSEHAAREADRAIKRFRDRQPPLSEESNGR